MTTYTIDQENNITAHTSMKEASAQTQTERFSSAKELARLAVKWPASRLVDIWNSLPGQTPVKRFTSRKRAVTRIWLAVEKLEANVGEHGQRVSRERGQSGHAPPKGRKAHTARDGSKKAEILRLLRQNQGATLLDLMTATGWQAHSVRGFISGTIGKKMCLTVASSKRESGERVYSLP